VFDALADIAAPAQLLDARPCARAGDRERQVGYLAAQLVQMRFKRQRHAEAVLAHEHHIVVHTAEAELVCLYADIRLHHRRAEDYVKLVLLKHTVKRAYRARAFGSCLSLTPEMLFYRYRIYLLHFMSAFPVARACTVAKKVV